VDDVLATGGTLAASAGLCLEAGYSIERLLVLLDLKLVPDFRWDMQPVLSVLRY
jgi:adenine phosphoribosyltransferase